MNTETDRELLEWSARAAGYKGKYLERDGCQEQGLLCSAGIEVEGMPLLGGWRYWNPLTDDGDALRLAVKLKLCIDCVFGAEMVVYFDGQKIKYSDMDITDNDPYSACRRAIVRAAAEIGKTMK